MVRSDGFPTMAAETYGHVYVRYRKRTLRLSDSMGAKWRPASSVEVCLFQSRPNGCGAALIPNMRSTPPTAAESIKTFNASASAAKRGPKLQTPLLEGLELIKHLMGRHSPLFFATRSNLANC